jgi:hypothetical protein
MRLFYLTKLYLTKIFLLLNVVGVFRRKYPLY